MKKSGSNGIKNFQIVIASIVTVAIFVFVAILMCTVVSFSFHVDEYFYAGTIGSTVAIVLTFVIWMPTGEQKGLEQTKYKNGARAYNERANYIINHQMFVQLQTFCKKKNDELEKQIITEKLSTLVIPYEVYELKKKLDRTKEEQERLELLWKHLSEKQHKMVEKLCAKGVKFEHLSPENITIGHVSKHAIVNHDNEGIYKVSRLIVKSLWGIGTTFFTYFVVIAPNTDFGIPQVVMIIMWFFTFLMAIYTAHITGYKAITVYRHKYNLQQAELCAEFLADNGISLDIEQEEEEQKK